MGSTSLPPFPFLPSVSSINLIPWSKSPPRDSPLRYIRLAPVGRGLREGLRARVTPVLGAASVRVVGQARSCVPPTALLLRCMHWRHAPEGLEQQQQQQQQAVHVPTMTREGHGSSRRPNAWGYSRLGRGTVDEQHFRCCYCRHLRPPRVRSRPPVG